jgi:hypothetical protein
MASHKAAGEDGIVAELLRYPICITWLTRLIQGIWSSRALPKAWQDAICVPLYKGRGRADDCDNFRGIMLLSVPGKVYARVLLNRIATFAESVLSESQNGFRKGRSCVDAIFSLRRLSELSVEYQQQLHVAFVDFTKAYDSVVRERLWSVLYGMGLPHSFIIRLASFHDHTTVKVRVASLLSSDFRTRLGLRQGCVLAPVLFNLYLDCVVRSAALSGGISVDIVDRPSLSLPHAHSVAATFSHKLTDTRFADDMTIIATTNAALQHDMSCLSKTGMDYNLVVSTKKTKYMVINDGGNATSSISLGASIIEKVAKFVYLGSEIADNGSVSYEVRRRIALALSAFSTLLPCLWKRREIGLKTKIQMFNALVVNRLLYAAETWTLSAADLSRLEALHTYCLRRILRLPWMKRVTNVDVRLQCKQPTLESVLRFRRLRWLGQIDRMDWCRFPKMLLWGRLKGGRRSGGQHLRWNILCLRDLKALRLEPRWRALCQDKNIWRRLCCNPVSSTARERMRAARKDAVQSDANSDSDSSNSSSDSSLSTQPMPVVVVPSAAPTTTLQAVTRRQRITLADRVGMSFDCDVCERTFRRPGDRKRHKCVLAPVHKNAVDPALLLFSCNVCDRKFGREGDRKRHRCVPAPKITPADRFEMAFHCGVCDRQFGREGDRKRHRCVPAPKITSTDRLLLPVICTVCDRHFAREGDRKRHRCTTATAAAAADD